MAKRLLRLEATKERTGKSTSGIYAEQADGIFPRSYPIGPNAVAWDESEIEGYLSVLQQASRDGLTWSETKDRLRDFVLSLGRGPVAKKPLRQRRNLESAIASV